jgi:hypothetical protein
LIVVAACGSDAANTAPAGADEAGVGPDSGAGEGNDSGSSSDASSDSGPTPITCSGGTKTTLRGKVFDPAGKRPVDNAVVYVPSADLPAIVDGASCDRCAPIANALASTRSAPGGDFSLDLSVSGKVPLVVQVGKWRRRVTVDVAPCVENAITDIEQTRLPKNHTEGNIPKIALSTGAGDALECFLRKVGIEDSEFTTKGGAGRVHLFDGNGGTNQFSGTGGATFAKSADDLWNDAATLKSYDLVLLSCEGTKHEETKSLDARNNMYAYSLAGGRILATHDHSYWFAEGPAGFDLGATWTDRAQPPLSVNASIDTSFARGAAFAGWADDVGARTGGFVPLLSARESVTATTSARSWLTFPNANQANETAHAIISAETPAKADSSNVCGRVVYTSMHVAPGDKSVPTSAFPTECTTTTTSQQEMAMEFMLFEASACLE